MLRVAVLCAHRAPGLAHLLHADPQRGRAFQVVVGLTTDPASEAIPLLRSAAVSAVTHDLAAFYAARGAARRDLVVRQAFDARTVALLTPYRPDVLVLSGYLHVVTAPLLDAFPGRIINVHDADLTIVDDAGQPKYRGLHSTRDAMRAGEVVTRCTAHLVTADVDAGPVLGRSDAYPVGDRHHYVQREWMMREAWGPLIARALHFLGRGSDVLAVAGAGA